ncbi:membrane protein insertase YidC [Paraferrimonas haliotis]|uniref:Membrane protein insertase YidC n=1 Tax=Paraferrimonas haliotis TaxID=2013866 RepID=A0AA37TXW7_9GAMM|nr:membrane protein insertase YidC [Paraferrimonas haliotis]GLS84804.1 membrane protein insertase YidC [Paraferrimonas haliotis]
MESQRNLLLIGLLLVSFFLWQQWSVEQNPQPAQTASVEQQSGIDSASSDVPMADSSIADTQTVSKEIITVVTDQFELHIDPTGGDIVYAALLTHKQELDGEDPFVLLEQTDGFTYTAQSGLIGRDGIDSSVNGRAVFASEKTQYQLVDGQDTLDVDLTYQAANGASYIKRFSLTRGQHDIKVSYIINNTTDKSLQMQMYGQLKQSISSESKNLMMPTYRGSAFSTTDTRYEKYTFEDMAKANLDKQTLGGWVAMLQHYFVSAWVPPANEQNKLFTSVVSGGLSNIGYRGSLVDVAPNSQATISADLFIGPKDQKALSALSETLNLTVDYGFLWWLAVPINKVLMFFQSIVINWGLAIILVTLTVRGLLYPLTKAQYTSMAKMRQLQPKLQELKERYGEDRQKMGQVMMELYKKEKVNPMGGCFPILLQMPIFIALYWVLLESVDLRHAEFLWLEDLSVMDPYFIMPALMGISMYVMQKLQPTPATMDPMQQKMMQWMPMIFVVFFIWFPAGLVLYWLVGNLVAIAQQLIIYRGLEKKGLK